MSMAIEERAKSFEFAKSFLYENDLLYLKAERKYAISKRMNDDLSGSIEMLEHIIAKMDQIDNNTKRELLYFRYITLQSLGVSYNRQSDSVDDSTLKYELLQSALKVRTQLFEIGSMLFEKDSISMKGVYNDLGMTYLYMYDCNSDETLLDEAQKLLMYSYELKIKHFGTDSDTTATAMRNLAALFISKKEYDSALKLAVESLAVVQRIYDSDNNLESMRSLKKIAIILFARYEASGNRVDLENAFINIEKANDIALGLYGGNVNHSMLREGLELMEKIEVALISNE